MRNEPYLNEIVTKVVRSYNPDYGDERVCQCGHVYHRHFDSYPDFDGKVMADVGCKYCECSDFVEKP